MQSLIVRHRSLAVGEATWLTANDERPRLRDYFCRDARRGEGFDHIARFDVAVVRDGDTALHPVRDFLGIILESPQRSDFAFEDHNVVAQEPNFGIALDVAIRYAASGNRSDLRDAEGFENLGASLIGFLDC